LSGISNFFDPSYFEMALEKFQQEIFNAKKQFIRLCEGEN
jgi:hypothetical protein